MMADNRKPRCMICNEQKPGIDVRPDSVINTLRWLNSHTLKYKNQYRPVVCRECFQKYLKARKSFERKRTSYLVIGVLFAVVLFITSRADPWSILAGLGVIALMYLLSLINYTPELELPRGALQSGAKRSGDATR